MMEAGYIAAFATGLLGGFGHCIGMCGPIIASCTFHNPAPLVAGRLLPHILYNTGRITTYTLIGALAGITGSFINVAARISGFQNIVAIAAGLLMIFMGISISGITGGTAWLERHNNLIMRAGKVLLQKRGVWRYYPLGILFGFIPCGLSYTAFTAAAGTGSLFQGMLLMLFFGLGTLLPLLLFGVAASYIGSGLRGMLYRSAGIIIILMGVYFLFRGIRLYV